MAYRFDNIHQTGLCEQEILRRAKEHQAWALREINHDLSLQDAIDNVIDAAAEYAQG